MQPSNSPSLAGQSRLAGSGWHAACPECAETWKLSGGERVVVRAVRAADAEKERAFVQALSRESRYYRFLTGGRVSDEVIDLFIESNAGLALVVTAEVDGLPVIVANGNYVVTPGEDGEVGEFAVAVADDWQGKGIGRRLIQRLRDAAVGAGLHRLRGDVLSENRRMLALMREFGFSTRRNPEDSLLYEVSLVLGELAGYSAQQAVARLLPA
ncbi:GCN5-like N-acetyltransferase [Cupriavidus basilensis OR16]|uniref:GCN5-like N-acetyltransferase n=1 Tax=Cupriavidus basilensis OR16 TaxID=1127483 RepID=H1RYB2_9BURK|nr:GNAT family N-acetyltransferase [Cupriavidus basilensis]EHP44603.1 GCN5-like N-acetyltransferase [Cupriavidus basilensis OR16]